MQPANKVRTGVACTKNSFYIKENKLTNREERSIDLSLEFEAPSNRKTERVCKKKIYICELCGKELVGMSMYHYHWKQLHRESIPKTRRAGKKGITRFTHKGRKKNMNLNPEPDGASSNKNTQCSKCHRSFSCHGWRIKHEMKCVDTECYTPGGVKMIYANELYCAYCPKKFAHSSSKELHEKMHTGDLPYECTSCNASFRLERTLSDHVKKCLTLVNLIWCDVCDFTTDSRLKLEAHYPKWHGVNLDTYETWEGSRGSNINGNSSRIFPQQNDPIEIPGNVTIKTERDPSETEVLASVSHVDEDDDLWSKFIIIDDDDGEDSIRA